MRRVIAAILALVGTFYAACGDVLAGVQVPAEYLILPGVGIGDFKLGMSKDKVLERLGEPRLIYNSDGSYTLHNLPTTWYRLYYGNITFQVSSNAVRMIRAHSPSYTFANGLGVGDSEDKIKLAFGGDFESEEGSLSYNNKGVEFNIDKENRTVEEIDVFRATDDHGETDAPDGENATRSDNPLPGPLVFPKIDRRPQAAAWQRGELERLLKYNPDADDRPEIDLRTSDLSKLDLRKSIEDLMDATFDHRTVWPASEKMPRDFDWQRIMELGKNPGLGVRSLHKEGITGRGVRIAIIDQPLQVDHREYADRLQLYEEIHVRHNTVAQMHGPAVASIAVGQTVGVAPEAELFYIAQFNFDWEKEGAPTLQYLAQGINRILEINEQLPPDNKIRVISISKGWTPNDIPDKEYKLIMEAGQNAQAAGMLVMCMSVQRFHEECHFNGLGRSPLANPDVFESYEPGWFYTKEFWAGGHRPNKGSFWVPMGARTTASPSGIDEYVYYRTGGGSWCPPYITGLYALAVQVDPAITPERFWSLAARTGRIIEFERNGKRRRLGPIINPVRLIRLIEAAKE